jgi:pimeloyl-ACP methyl ester carboxylesterase
MSRWRIALVVLAILVLGTGVLWWLQRPQTILVGGRKVQIHLAGSGSPAVVIEAGFTGGIFLERLLQNRLAATTQTVAYERAGLGASGPGPAPRDAEQIANELHVLLAATYAAPPYVLVGHSAGALYTRVFAHLYPNEIAGLVFVDPATEETYERLPKETPADWTVLTELANKLGPRSGVDGQLLALSQTIAEVRAAEPLPLVPTVILNSTKPLGAWPLKTQADLQALQKEQGEFAATIGGVKRVAVDGTDHLTILGSEVTANEILAIVRAARQRR